MIILLLFAFISGLITILAPCIWPLLPIVLSSSATGNKLKALGVTLGVMVSFAFFTLVLSYIVKIIPFDPNYLRVLAVVVITILGLSLIIPALSQIIEGAVSKLSSRLGGRMTRGGGLGSGLLTGLALGIVWSPCAGPILASIAALSVTRAVNLEIVFVTIAYTLGIGIPLLLFSILGSHLFNNTKFISPYTHRLQQVFGVIMLLTALLILTNYDKVLETKLLNIFPNFSSLTSNLESSAPIKKELSQLSIVGRPTTLEAPSENANLGKAPEFVGITKWLNTDKALTLTDLKGKVVLVDFWTYTCINCIRTLPFVTSWYEKYKDMGFVVVGVHTPEFEFEKNTDNVLSAIKQYNIHYPVAQDNDYATWKAYSNQYWPAEYLIDAKGNLRRAHFGEGEYDLTEKAIQDLLKESGAKVGSDMVTMPDLTPKSNISPESYLGSARMVYLYPNGEVGNGKQNFTLANNLPVNSFSFGGEWTIFPEMAQSGNNSSLDYHFFAGKVFLVMRPPSGAVAKVRVFLDGKVMSEISVDSDKLYSLIDLPQSGDHLLHLEFETPGTQIFVFTFG